jgi:antitoxin CptB|tara:strand:- start:4918 stop:5163 length:246 start_codon:yes stop_codon:yes gene_type:complete
MSSDIDILKKRIIFRASHRGSKEMDMLMKSFTESIIDNLNPNELKILDKLVDLNDEDLLKIKTNKSTKDKIYKLFVDYNFK